MDSENKNRLFANIGKLITSSLELNNILEGIMEEVKLYFNPQHWSLIRYDHTSDTLLFVIFNGQSNSKVENISLKPGEGIAGTVVTTGKSIFVPDTSIDPRFSDKVDKIIGFQTKSIIAVPIKVKEWVFGVIEIINRENQKQFTEDEHLILKTIADFSGIAFANNLLYEKAISESEIDNLTGLYNKGKLDEFIKEHADRETPHRRDADIHSDIIAVYIDLNDFKEVNDTYGHAEGDEVLRKVSMRLGSLFRSDDLLFRIGGDEFLVLIKIEEGMESGAIIKRIDDVLSNLKVTSIKKGYTVTLSFGIKTGKIGEIDRIIHDADLDMYKKKRKGKEN
jgi:diguanylate cyclase (GGDEF)-like protein